MRDAALDTPHGAIVTIDFEGVIRNWDSAAEQMFGFSAEEMTGESLDRLFSSECAVWRSDTAALLQRLGALRAEAAARRKTGGTIAVELQLTLSRSADGEPALIHCFCADAVERSPRLEIIRERDFLAAVLDAIHAPVLALDARGAVLMLNRPAERLTGYKAEDFGERPVWSVVVPRGRQREVREHFEAIRHRGGIGIAEFEWPCRDGRLRTIAWSVSPLAGDTFVPGGCFIGLGIDVTERRRTEEALRSSERFRRSVLEAVPASIAVLNASGKVVIVNEAWRRFAENPGSGMEEAAGEGAHFFAACRRSAEAGHRDAAVALRGVRNVVRGRESCFAMQYRCDLSGGLRWFLLYVSPFPFDGNGAVVTFVDITQRKTAESALERSEKELRLVAENVPALFAYVGADQRYRFVNRKYEEMFRKPASAIVGMHVRELLGEEAYEQRRPYIEAALAGRRAAHEIALELPGGKQHWLEMTLVPDRARSRQVTGFFVLAHDITRRKEAEQALRVNQRKLKELTARLITAQEEERRRIAADLHDDVNQKLAAATISLSKLKKRLPADLASELSNVQERLQAVSNDIRHLSRRFHPSLIEHVGLVPALKAFCAEFSEREGIAVTLQARAAGDGIPRNLALCLYRVTQEALHNVARHAKSSRAYVRLTSSGGEIHLSIEDEGAGFDVEQVREPRGLGLISMEERVRLVGGRFLVQSRPGNGATIDVYAPVRKTKR